ncbi:MAG: CinA family protein [Alphaproteobacteria bacterium]
MFPKELIDQTKALVETCRDAGLMIGTAESCTGGLLAACLTEIPGASQVFERGFVTYTNTAKVDMLGIPEALIRDHGAVSEEIARAMAEGVLSRVNADLSASITGIAGPGGATPAKPVGLVHMASIRRGGEMLQERHVFSGSRNEVRLAAVTAAIAILTRQVA